MKTLIYLPGSISDPFFSKEIKYCKKHFDKVYVISYEGNRDDFRKLSKEYGFEYKIINRVNPKSILNVLFTWRKKYEHVRKECSSIKGYGFLKKILYCLFYCNYAEQAVPYMKEIVEKSDGDVYISSFWLSRTAYAAAVMNLERSTKIKKIVSRAHGFDLYKERVDHGYLPFRDFICANIDEIRFISKDGFEYHEEHWPDALSERSVYYMGSLNEKQVRKVMATKSVPVIATTAYIRDVKRYDLIIDTLSKIKSEFIWYQYGDGELKQSIEKLADTRLGHRHYQFKGNIPNEEILEVYRKDDVDYLLNLSDSEGLPVSFMEAMSIGVPVIARNIGGVSEIVNNSNGRLLDIRPDTDLWALEIEKELENRVIRPEVYKEKSENAIETWKRRFNSDENIDRFFRTISES